MMVLDGKTQPPSTVGGGVEEDVKNLHLLPCRTGTGISYYHGETQVCLYRYVVPPPTTLEQHHNTKQSKVHSANSMSHFDSWTLQKKLPMCLICV